MNDNELRGLPTNIDLVESAISLLKVCPTDTRRKQHLISVMSRVTREMQNELDSTPVLNTQGIPPRATHFNRSKNGHGHLYFIEGYKVYFWDKYQSRWMISKVAKSDLIPIANCWDTTYHT